eukprot:TRINITY_DN75744_c0_g1_i1.p1 TRINITY_DN75744_c0_g1~~TRINITY_DN75744_c0_g1_i1.p1  ORF type:complete len:169 (+),score=13.14 TRINITY_DN75744_c0_g1_i1:187-693(+)
MSTHQGGMRSDSADSWAAVRDGDHILRTWGLTRNVILLPDEVEAKRFLDHARQTEILEKETTMSQAMASATAPGNVWQPKPAVGESTWGWIRPLASSSESRSDDREVPLMHPTEISKTFDVCKAEREILHPGSQAVRRTSLSSHHQAQVRLELIYGFCYLRAPYDQEQ